MKIRVMVLQKLSTVNPPDKVVKDALHQMGCSLVTDVHLGRYLEFEFGEDLTDSKVRMLVTDICRSPKLNLVNPVMEDFAIIPPVGP